MSVRRQSCAHIFVALEAGRVGIHFWLQLTSPRPSFYIGVVRCIQMHLVAGNAGEFAAAKTRRGLHAVEFASCHSNHSVIPESVAEKIRLGPVNKIFLISMIRRTWLYDETLCQIVLAWAEAGAVPIEIDFIRHVVKGPNAMALPTGEP